MEETKVIGAAILPDGTRWISKIERPFPKGDWADVWDMRNIRYRNVELKKIMLTGDGVTLDKK